MAEKGTFLGRCVRTMRPTHFARSAVSVCLCCVGPVSWGRQVELTALLGKGGNVTSGGWQVTLCDPMWHVSSRSGVATL